MREQQRREAGLEGETFAQPHRTDRRGEVLYRVRGSHKVSAST